MAQNSLLIRNIGTIYGIQESPQTFKKAEAMSVLDKIHNAFILIEGAYIKAFGHSEKGPERADYIVDARGGFVLPAFCDSHTHTVFAQPREKEFVDRIKGLSYEMIAANGGGILNSAAKLNNLSEDELYDRSLERLNKLIYSGTGAVEIKSGYGLNVEAEIKMLRVIKRLKESSDVLIKATFLGAHAIPSNFKDNRKAYIDLIINEMLPFIASEDLADYCDVFCDKGFFTVEETDTILNAAWKYGLKPKIHANELAVSGGVQVGIKNRAVSVDHLERIGKEEIDLLKQAETIPTLLPGTSFFLNIPYAPARKMIDEGLGIALASDYNPGSSPSGSMMFILSLACTQMRLLPEEAINASTINGAFAMECQEKVGSIATSKLANLIITRKIPSLAYIPYAFTNDHIQKVIIKGKIVRA